MKHFRILIERILYFLAIVGTTSCLFSRIDSETGENAQSVLNFVNGSVPWDIATIILLIIFMLIGFGLIKNVLKLREKNLNDLKNWKDPETQIIAITLIIFTING